MKKTSPSTHQACRSLLQKAVRRGDVNLTEQVVHHLYEIKDTEWLRKRTLVITFEECWPLGAELHLPLKFEDALHMLKRIATTRKMKDATGLGSLAYEYSTGVSTVLLGEETLDRDILVIARAIKEPQRFWNWAIKQCSQDNQKAQFVQITKESHRRGGWPWDLAFMQAAAYLAITKGIPNVTTSTQASIECPLWVALDKHTTQGKDALRKTAKLVGVTSRQLMWISFYCESALTSESSESYWWSREIQWRLHQFELDYEKAKSIWEKAQQIIPDILEEETTELQKHFQTPSNDLFASQEDISVPNSLPSTEIDNSSSFQPKNASSTNITHQKDTHGVVVQGLLFPPD